MFDTIEDMLGLAVLEEFFGKFDFLGIIEVIEALKAFEMYVDLGEVGFGAKLLMWSIIFFALRVALTVLTVIFILRVWKIVSYHYFKILDEEGEKKIRKEFFARKDEDVEVSVVTSEEKHEVVKIECIEETKEIEIPVPMDTTKEVEIPKQIEKPKKKRTLKEKIIGFLFNE